MLIKFIHAKFYANAIAIYNASKMNTHEFNKLLGFEAGAHSPFHTPTGSATWYVIQFMARTAILAAESRTQRMWACRGPNASNPARGRTLPGQERPSNGRPDESQRRPGSMLCPVGLPGALSVDILALLLYWPTYAPITVRLTSDTHVAYYEAVN